MKIELAYGDRGLQIQLPQERSTVITPSHQAPTDDQPTAFSSALRAPLGGQLLRDLVEPGKAIAISLCDGTRPQPHRLVVEAILDEIGHIDVNDVVVLIATGTHRGNTDTELRSMLGDEIVESVRVVNHDARDASSLVWVGELGAGVPVWLSREWIEADVRITAGLVEPHFFAGFSGGPKMVAPGLAGLETVLALHDAARIGHPEARWGILQGNPVHDGIRAIAQSTGVQFSIDVVIDREKRLVAVFAGELTSVHRAACAVAKAASMQAVSSPFDVVVTSNGGFPLDQNLYQAVKGMSAAAQIVKPGGTIFCAAECRDGFPDHGSYREELTAGASPQALLQTILAREQTVPDQWQIQIQAAIQSKARVVMCTSYLSDDELASAHLEQTNDIGLSVEKALARAGPEARVCVLPEGPRTIPFLNN